MNFSDKLQKLRKENGLTQEQLAEKLFVSRTAVSKWERNVGYPNLDSLKLIAKEFSLSLDELLSSDEIITIAKDEKKNTIGDFVGLSFSIIDFMAVLFVFLPLYGQPEGDYIKAVNLLSLTEFPLYIMIPFCVEIGLLITCGIARLVVYFLKNIPTGASIQIISIIISSIALIFFIATLEPYAATLMFLLLAFKVIMLFRYKSLEK